MNRQMRKRFFLVCLLLLTFSFVTKREAAAQSNQLIVENAQPSETYTKGGTCISGTHNLFVADVDGDDVMEMITGGSMYWVKNGTQTAREAPLRIWNWNGQNLSIEKSQNWPGNINCVHAGDANGDGVIEIMTAGSVRNGTESYLQLKIWQWNGEALVLKGSYDVTSVNSIFVSDVDKDGSTEIISVGKISNRTQFCAKLCVWRLDENSLTLKKSVQWGAPNATCNSVYAYDLDNDGVNEIVTGGYSNNLKNSSGQLRVWQGNGESFSLEASEEWRLKDNGYGLTISGGVMGNTVVHNVKVGDVDGDGAPEVVTGGFTYDGEKIDAQLRIWNWTSQSLTLEKSQEWITQDLVDVECISINDVDDDGGKEIVTSGGSGSWGSFKAEATTPNSAQLRVWSWNGTALTLKHSTDWYIDDGAMAFNVATGDVDKDEVIEIVTVGCTYLGNMCDPGMRIWSIKGEPSPFPYVHLTALGIVTAVVLAAAFLLLRKRRK